ncbi:MAG: S8 family peptidase [Ignavibacteriales bacterium]|nr:S8 family peptidase [Ignavibacteriales bacterium]
MSLKIIRHIFLFVIVPTIIISSNVFGQKVKHWVFFKDKGVDISLTGEVQKNSIEYLSAISQIDNRALTRRAKTLPPNQLIDECDLPVYDPYIRTIELSGGILAVKSKWFNAATFYLTSSVKSEIEKLPFVKNVRRVVAFKEKNPIKQIIKNQTEYFEIQSLDYGYSFTQLDLLNIPALHTLGITGKKIRVGLLDSGFRWRAHEALQTRKVIAEHDFIFNDGNTANEDNDSRIQDAHGTLTFSILGGYKQGKLIGGAFDSEFLLGKTEYIPSETIQEEDNWAAGLEWMEGLGVDVISSSVGYDIFDDGGGYFWANGDFNGRTSIVAQAAVRAARLGVLVCTSMGNEGNGNGIEGTLLTPADADSIISVGGVAFDKYRIPHLWVSSSTGPTNDGRVKPDVVALSEGVYNAVTPGPATYGSSSGNSVSTPLVAGAASLILSCRPELTPIQLRDILRSTAKHVDSINYFNFPNNFLGWGLIDAFRAATSIGPVFGNEPSVNVISGRTNISVKVASLHGINPDSVLLRYSINNEEEKILKMQFDSSIIYPTSGKYDVEIPDGQIGASIGFYITAIDSAANFYQSPPPATTQKWWIYYGIPGLQPQPANTDKILLEQNFPNPFYSYNAVSNNLMPGSLTVIPFQLLKKEKVIIKIYNMLGEEILEIANGIFDSGRNFAIWNASGFPTGVYFYRLTTASTSIAKKMVYLR